MGLQSVQDFAYLTINGACSSMDAEYHARSLDTVLASLSAVGFSDEEQSNIFSVLALVLHLGNIKFEDNGYGSKISASSAAPVMSMGRLK